MEVLHLQFNFWIFFTNALCALALNFSIFLVIGRTGAVTIRVAGVLKDWILIALSTIVFPESTITALNIISYAVALSGVLMYNYLKVKDVRASNHHPTESIPKDWKQDKKSSDLYTDDDNSKNNGGVGNTLGPATALEMASNEESTLLFGSRPLSQVGRSPLSRHIS